MGLRVFSEVSGNEGSRQTSESQGCQHAHFFTVHGDGELVHVRQPVLEFCGSLSMKSPNMFSQISHANFLNDVLKRRGEKLLRHDDRHDRHKQKTTARTANNQSTNKERTNQQTVLR